MLHRPALGFEETLTVHPPMKHPQPWGNINVTDAVSGCKSAAEPAPQNT